MYGEGALLAASDAKRTGRMRRHRGHDPSRAGRSIRAELNGVLVVQGGPGTGKTAVALHRAAYLLYTHRERLARTGVLLVGPNQTFLRYIEKVLPSLGETGVVTMTPGELFPGVVAVADDVADVAALKGSLAMADVMAAAVRARQRVPDGPRTLNVEGHQLVLRPHVVAAARAHARRNQKPHNLARVGYVKEILDGLVSQYARVIGVQLSSDNRSELMADLRDSADVRREVNLTWMPLTPTGLLESLYADPGRLAAVTPELDDDERASLHRERGDVELSRTCRYSTRPPNCSATTTPVGTRPGGSRPSNGRSKLNTRAGLCRYPGKQVVWSVPRHWRTGSPTKARR